jgi:DNA replicative helicase MCM subunit Mcm2 (Cdc46/Mcm family)
MKITIDPDIDLEENLEFTIELLKAKMKDRKNKDKNSCEMFLDALNKLEKIDKKISIEQIKEELETEDAEEIIESLKQKGIIYEIEKGYIARI